MLLSFDTKNQIITRTDANRAIANSTDYFEVSVTFSANWNGYDKTICFKNGDTEINIMLVNNAVPKEAHLNLGVGTWKVSIIGIKGNHKILTNAVNLPVGASGYIGTTGPTPRVYEELLTIIQSLHTEVASEAALRSAVEQFVDENFHDIVISDVYSKSEIDSMIVTKTVNDLVYYWNKSQTYNRAEIEALIEAAIQGTYIVTQTLPTTDISTHAIYLVPKESATVGDYYDEYINTTGTSAGWEHIGTTEIDLSNYYTKAEINALLDNKVDKVSGKGLSTNDYDNTAKSIVDGVTSALANKVDKETGKGLSTNDYDNTAKGIVDGVTAALAGKVDKETGKGLSSNDYDNTEKAKLAGISDGATKTESSLTNGHIEIDDVDVTVYDDTALDSRVDVVEQDLSTDTATVEGNPLNFTTLTAQKAVETVISLEPIQDLHGYDHPWPAGGGKNLLKNSIPTQTINGITWTLQSDGTVIANGTATATSQYGIPFSELSGNFYYNGCQSGGSRTTYDVYAWDDTTNTRYYKWDETTPSVSVFGPYDLQEINIPEGHDGRIMCRIYNGVTVNNVVFKPMICLATETDPTFAPYSNYCPIDGRTETSLVGCGKNQMHCMVGTLAGITTTINDDGSITISGKPTNSGELDLYFDRDNPIVVPDNAIFSIGVNKNNTFSCTCVKKGGWYSIPSGESEVAITSGRYYRFYFYLNYIHTYNLRIYPMIRLASNTDATYEPYIQSNNLTIQFGETVYGATFTMETGELVIDKYMVTLSNNDTYNYGTWTTGAISVLLSSSYPKARNQVKVLSEIYDYDKVETLVSGSSTYIRFLQATSVFANIDDFKAVAIGTKIVYRLATPRTITLTPNEISLLNGVNNISTDGDGITLTYRDGKVATLGDLTATNENVETNTNSIQSILGDIAPVEQTTATQAHSAGELLLWNNKLVKVTDSIAVDDTLVLGTNVDQTTIAAELALIVASLA